LFAEPGECELRVCQGRRGWIASQCCAQSAGFSLGVFSLGDESDVYGCRPRRRMQGDLAGLDPVIAQGTQKPGNPRSAESGRQAGESRSQVFEEVALARQSGE
jgi:hypothetical protein